MKTVPTIRCARGIGANHMGVELLLTHAAQSNFGAMAQIGVGAHGLISASHYSALVGGLGYRKADFRDRPLLGRHATSVPAARLQGVVSAND